MVKREKVEEKVEEEESVKVLCEIKNGEAVCYLPDQETFKKAAGKAPSRITFEVSPDKALGEYCKLSFEASKKEEPPEKKD